MRKSFILLGGMLLALTISTTSCSNDDDDVNGGGGHSGSVTPSTAPTTAGQLLGDEGVRLPDNYRVQAVGPYTYSYDATGRLYSISDEDDTYFNGGKLSYVTTDEDGTEKVDIALNSDNLISKVAYDWEENDGNDYEKENGTITISYNSDKQVSSISININYSGRDDGDSYKGKATETYTCTYADKTLTNVVCKWTESEGGHKDSGQDTYTFVYSSIYNNKFYQYTNVLSEMLFDFGIEEFSYIGMLGRASAQLPTKIKSVYVEDGDKWESSDTCGPYSFNTDGTLSKADDYNYTYTTLSGNNSRQVYTDRQDKRKPLIRYNRHLSRESKD